MDFFLQYHKEYHCHLRYTALTDILCNSWEVIVMIKETRVLTSNSTTNVFAVRDFVLT